MDFSQNPCSYFTEGKKKASTLSLSVLVVIEMFNALNGTLSSVLHTLPTVYVLHQSCLYLNPLYILLYPALSEDSSLLVMPPWCNPYLLLAIVCSMGVHFIILYVPFLATIFTIVPLSAADW
jgi:Ca2+-transporting ATPase